MYFKYKYKIHSQNVFQIQNTYMYFKYVFQILVFEILPSTAPTPVLFNQPIFANPLQVSSCRVNSELNHVGDSD